MKAGRGVVVAREGMPLGPAAPLNDGRDDADHADSHADPREQVGRLLEPLHDGDLPFRKAAFEDGSDRIPIGLILTGAKAHDESGKGFVVKFAKSSNDPLRGVSMVNGVAEGALDLVSPITHRTQIPFVSRY